MRWSSVTGIVLLTGSAMLAVPTDRARADVPGGQIAVLPGDPAGLYGQPSIGLGATSPGTPAGSAHAADTGGTNAVSTCGYEPTGMTTSDMFAAGTPGYAGTFAGGGGHGYYLVCNGVHEAWLNGPDRLPPGVVPVTPEQLAQQAYRLLVLPAPAPHFSPDVKIAARSATVVGEHTWLWTDKVSWAVQSKRVQAGTVWAEAVAKPTKLLFTPGNGRTLSCNGPGTVYSTALGLHAASPDCDYVFDAPRSHVDATFAIEWTVRWTGSTGTAPAAGTLPNMTSRAATSFVVAEVQALNAG